MIPPHHLGRKLNELFILARPAHGEQRVPHRGVQLHRAPVERVHGIVEPPNSPESDRLIEIQKVPIEVSIQQDVD
jgi:hypothetical protein